jgi:hypothetical protein
MTPKEILLALAAPAVAGTVGLVVTFSGSDIRPAGSVPTNVRSFNQTSRAESRPTSDKENPDLVSSTTFRSAPRTTSTEPPLKSYPSLEVARQELEARGIYPRQAEPEVYQAQMPLAFLNLAGVLPATEEAVAAIQQMQKDFVDSTGAATADPADPDYADRWDQFQALLDDQFCAMFGTEACNALSIERVHQRGHF